MVNILLNKNNQPRSGWRIVLFLFAFFLFSAIFRITEESVIAVFEIAESEARMLYFAINGAGLLFLALIIGWAAGKLFEDLPFKALGASFTDDWLKHLALGVAVGAATLLIAVLIAFLGGGERFELSPTNSLRALLTSLVVIGFGAAWEEAFFRGYIFQTLVRSNLAWLAIALTSIFFGIVHYGNPAATFISTINTTLAGVWFGLAYLKTRDLWLVWGIHFMWNWMQGAVFGIEVSGLTDITPNPLLREIDSGPTWLTGTTYGLEGGIACTVAIVISMACIYFSNAKSQRGEDAKEEH